MLGERLKELRKQKGLSQYEAASRLGFSRGKLANYEQGSREPDYDTLKVIAKFYDATTDYLLGYSEHPSFTKDMKLDEQVEELYKILQGMPEKERKDIEKQILTYAKFLADANKD